MKIYVSGNSGVGKTHFVNKVSSEYDIPVISEVIRSHPDKTQLFYLNVYLGIHNEYNDFISDRSFLDIACWNGFQHKFGDVKNNVDLVILPPVPSIEFIKNNITNWTEDPIRLSAYKNRWGFLPITDKLPLFLEKQFQRDYTYLLLAYEILGWNVEEIPSHDNYFDWQIYATDIILNYRNKK